MTYDDPFRLRILKNLTALLQTITPANGYRFDLSESVFRGRSVFGDGDPVPMVSILEAVKNPDGLQPPPGGTTNKENWGLIIQGWADDDITGNPTDPAQYLMADVKKALADHRAANGRDYTYLGMEGEIEAMRFNGGVVRPADDVSGKAFFWLLLDLELVEDMTNPYA